MGISILQLLLSNEFKTIEENLIQYSSRAMFTLKWIYDIFTFSVGPIKKRKVKKNKIVNS